MSLDWLKRFGVRWVTLFFLLYVLFDDTGNTAVSSLLAIQFFGADWLANASFSFWDRIVPWVGERLVGHPIAVSPGGDLLFNFLQAGIILVIAFVCATLWATFDRDHRRERTLYQITRVVVRYGLAVTMVVFGLSKTFHIQFAYPGPIHLMEPMGDFSPYGLMWASMGYPTLYSFFGGFAEVAGGVLVLFRRTTTLGALIIAGVMTNVVMINVSYFVSVRLEASLYLLMAIFLLAPDAQRLVNAFLGYQALPAVPSTRVWPKRWMGPASRVLKAVFIAYLLIGSLLYYQGFVNARVQALKMPMTGLYQAKGNTSSWVRVGIEGYNDGHGTKAYFMAVRNANDEMIYYALHIDPLDSTHGKFKLVRCGGYACPYWNPFPPNPKHAVLNYTTDPSLNELTLSGEIDGGPIVIRLVPVDTSKFLLQRTRFHIIEPDDSAWDV